MIRTYDFLLLIFSLDSFLLKLFNSNSHSTNLHQLQISHLTSLVLASNLFLLYILFHYLFINILLYIFKLLILSLF
jgi:hypothetical protein